MLDEINRHSRARQGGFPDFRPVDFLTDIDAQRCREFAPPAHAFHRTIERTDNPDIVAHRHQILRQSADHIAQATRLDERFNFRSRKKNPQWTHDDMEPNIAAAAEKKPR